MGYELYREVMRWAPSDLDTGELAFLLVIADLANERKRTCAPGQDELCRHMRMEWSGVKAVLRRLAKHKIEVRQVVGKDKLGRDVYAHHGARTTYVIPHFAPLPSSACQCPEHADAVAEGVTAATPSTAEGVATATPKTGNGVTSATPSRDEGVATASRRGSHSDPHLPHVPQEEDPHLLPSQRIVRGAGLGLSEEEERSFIAWANEALPGGAKGAPWWRKVRDNGDLPDLVDRWRADAIDHMPPRPAARASPATRRCAQCGETFTPTPGNSYPCCPTCQPERPT